MELTVWIAHRHEKKEKSYLLLPMSMMTILELECWRASSNQVVKWLKVSLLWRQTHVVVGREFTGYLYDGRELQNKHDSRATTDVRGGSLLQCLNISAKKIFHPLFCQS